MTKRTGLSNAGAAARKLYRKRYGGVSVKNVSTSERDEFEGKVTDENGDTLLFVSGRTIDETTAMMCGALRAVPSRKRRIKWK